MKEEKNKHKNKKNIGKRAKVSNQNIYQYEIFVPVCNNNILARVDSRYIDRSRDSEADSWICHNVQRAFSM